MLARKMSKLTYCKQGIIMAIYEKADELKNKDSHVKQNSDFDQSTLITYGMKNRSKLSTK